MDVITERALDRTELVPGRTYRVVLDDCCIRGFFVAEYVGSEITPGLEDWGPGYGLVHFRDAEIDMEQGKVTFYEVSAAETPGL